LVTVACFLPGQAQDLSAPPRNSIESHKISYLYVHRKHKILTDNYGEKELFKKWIFYQQYKKKLGRWFDPAEPLDRVCYKIRQKFFTKTLRIVE
jgi:hypothetical protein